MWYRVYIFVNGTRGQWVPMADSVVNGRGDQWVPMADSDGQAVQRVLTKYILWGYVCIRLCLER